MSLTDKQRRVLVDLSDGDWQPLVPHHSRSVVATLHNMGCIRPDHTHIPYEDRIWTITPIGLECLEESA